MVPFENDWRGPRLIAKLVPSRLDNGIDPTTCLEPPVPGEEEELLGISFSSGTFLSLARGAYERGHSNRSESTTAIILSWLAIEAFLNEAVEQATIHSQAVTDPSYKEKVDTMVSVINELRASPGTKVKVMHLILTGRKLDTETALYESFVLLRKIRNALVHKKPEVTQGVWDPEAHHAKLVKRLVAIKVIDKPPTGSPVWEPYVCVPAVAAWAHNTALEIIRLIISLFTPDEKLKFQVELPVQLQVKQPPITLPPIS